MSDKNFNLKYIRTCIRQQLRGKPHWPLVQPLRAEYDGLDGQGRPLVLVTDTRNGSSLHVVDNSWGHRMAILQLMQEDLPQAVRMREYLRAATTIPEGWEGSHETPFWYFQQEVWDDLIGDAPYNPDLVILHTDEGPFLRVRCGCYVWGGLDLNKALQYWDDPSILVELSKLYHAGVQMIEGHDDTLGLMDPPEGMEYDPLQEE